MLDRVVFHVLESMIWLTLVRTKSSPRWMAPWSRPVAGSPHAGSPMRSAPAGDMPCMSWHWSGLIHEKSGTVPDARSRPKDFSYGTILFRRRFLGELMSEKYINGLCFCAYSLTVVPLMTGAYSPSKPALGMDCM